MKAFGKPGVSTWNVGNPRGRSDLSWVLVGIVAESLRHVMAGISWLTIVMVASILFASHARQVGAFPRVCWY